MGGNPLLIVGLWHVPSPPGRGLGPTRGTQAGWRWGPGVEHPFGPRRKPSEGEGLGAESKGYAFHPTSPRRDPQPGQFSVLGVSPSLRESRPAPEVPTDLSHSLLPPSAPRRQEERQGLRTRLSQGEDHYRSQSGRPALYRQPGGVPGPRTGTTRVPTLQNTDNPGPSGSRVEVTCPDLQSTHDRTGTTSSQIRRSHHTSADPS